MRNLYALAVLTTILGAACDAGDEVPPLNMTPAAPDPLWTPAPDLERVARAATTTETFPIHTCCTRTVREHTDIRKTNDPTCNTGTELVSESCDTACCFVNLITNPCPSIFSCQGGPCPIIPDATDAQCMDRDGDGLLDTWESGTPVDGMLLPMMGANPSHKDMFVELDWYPMVPPSQATVRELKRAFCAAPFFAGSTVNPDGIPGINLWVDTGTLTDPAGRESGVKPCTCGDGLNNDSDAGTDGDDPDCLVFNPRLSEDGTDGAPNCGDGMDNDGDFLPDSFDPQCNVLDRTRTEANVPANSCSDGRDQDGDNLIDEADPDCLVGDNFGAGSVVSPVNVSGLNAIFDFRKTVNFSSTRKRVFRYALVASKPTNGAGTSTGGNTSTTLNDTTKTWVVNEWVGNTVTLTGGTGNGQSARISSNTATGLVVALAEDGAAVGSCSDGADNGNDGGTDGTDTDCIPWTTVPDATSQYSIGLPGGIGELGGNDVLVYGDRPPGALNEDATTLMHELGHNLGLDHGGNQPNNCKSNYVSIMNYDHAGGIRQNSVNGGQDLDGNGLRDGLIIDFSPPRFVTRLGVVRGVAPLANLFENALDESATMDVTDHANRFAYTSGLGNKIQAPLHGDGNNDGTPDGIDWLGDGDFDDGANRIVNIDNSGSLGFPVACTNGRITYISPMFPMTGHDDWSAISVPFGHFDASADAPRAVPVREPEWTRAELVKLQTEMNTTDLAVLLSAPSVQLGQDLTYAIQVQNQKPNPADVVTVTGTLPASTVYVSDTASCARAGNVLTCSAGQLYPGNTRNLSVTVKTGSTCVNGRPAPLTTTVSVKNDTRLAGADPDPGDNTRTLTITPVDTTAPKLQDLRVSPSVLWPPNHKLVPVKVSTTTTDACGSVKCKITSITSNEQHRHKEPDWFITGADTALLRAERSGDGKRVYTLTTTCKDGSGNATSGWVRVTVGHDRR